MPLFADQNVTSQFVGEIRDEGYGLRRRDRQQITHRRLVANEASCAISLWSAEVVDPVDHYGDRRQVAALIGDVD